MEPTLTSEEVLEILIFVWQNAKLDPELLKLARERRQVYRCIYMCNQIADKLQQDAEQYGITLTPEAEEQ